MNDKNPHKHQTDYKDNIKAVTGTNAQNRNQHLNFGSETRRDSFLYLRFRKTNEENTKGDIDHVDDVMCPLYIDDVVSTCGH